VNDLITSLQIALDVIRVGASVFTNNFSNYNRLENNIGREVKIMADIKLNELLVDELNKKSSFNIVSEEGDRNVIYENEYNWILDPLDGSFNYMRGIPIYCISIGLWKGYEPVLGVVYDLVQNDIYHGIVREGAYKNNEQISVSKVTSFSDAVLCTGFPVNYNYSRNKIIIFANKVQKFKKIRLLGSAAISLSFVASGVVDAYSEDNIMIWDVAAGISIVKAAGGNVLISKGSINNSLNVSAMNGLLSVK
jgi:myo-inositol-1(or 4)-monophosphatase